MRYSFVKSVEQFPFLMLIVAQLPILPLKYSKIYKSGGLQLPKGERKILSNANPQNFEDTRPKNYGTTVKNGTLTKILSIPELGTALH